MSRTISLLVLLTCLAACSSNTTDHNNMPPPRELTRAEAQVVAADNAFGFRLFNALNTEPDSNIFISPMSVSMVLAMTLNGARGETRTAIERTLGLAGIAPAEINGAYRGLINMLRGLDPTVTMGVANSIWAGKDFQVEPAFAEISRKYFDATTESLDFASPQAPKRINGWVDDATHGRISEIVPNPIPLDAVMYLINAIYFKGSWSVKFDPKKTQDAEFALPSGRVKQVSMMYRKDTLAHQRNDIYSAVDLEYGNGGFGMVVILPARDESVDNVAASLDSTAWRKLLAGFTQTTDIDLYLPKFKMEYGSSLNDVLKSLGMGIAFTAGLADFSGISSAEGRNLAITNVKHKTFVEVNEEGTEAAAATSVEISRTSLPPSFRADRPFLAIIYEKHTGAILFMGKIVDPAPGL